MQNMRSDLLQLCNDGSSDGPSWGIPQPRSQVVTFVSCGHVDGTALAGVSEQYGGVEFEKKHNQRYFLAKSRKMEDWDIPDEDDFESRYADELEMLDDLGGEGKCLLLC